MKTVSAIVAAAGLAVGSSLANAQGGAMAGAVQWTDSAGATHPSRNVEVRIYAANSGGDHLVMSTYTDLDGNWLAVLPAPAPGDLGYFGYARANTTGGRVVPLGGGDPSVYQISAGAAPLGGGFAGVASADNTSAAGQAFSIADAIFTSHTSRRT